jgi:hypothetical protein
LYVEQKRCKKCGLKQNIRKRAKKKCGIGLLVFMLQAKKNSRSN